MEISILKAVREGAKDLRDAGVMSEDTLAEFDALCIPPVKHEEDTEDSLEQPVQNDR